MPVVAFFCLRAMASPADWRAIGLAVGPVLRHSSACLCSSIRRSKNLMSSILSPWSSKKRRRTASYWSSKRARGSSPRGSNSG